MTRLSTSDRPPASRKQRIFLRPCPRDDLSRALGYAQTRSDVTGALSTALNDRLTVYGAVGRTISKRDPNSATLLISGGVSLNFVAWNR